MKVKLSIYRPGKATSQSAYESGKIVNPRLRPQEHSAAGSINPLNGQLNPICK